MSKNIQLWLGPNAFLLGHKIIQWKKQFEEKHSNGKLCEVNLIGATKSEINEKMGETISCIESPGFFQTSTLVLLQIDLATLKNTSAELSKRFIKVSKIASPDVIVVIAIADLETKDKLPKEWLELADFATVTERKNSDLEISTWLKERENFYDLKLSREAQLYIVEFLKKGDCTETEEWWWIETSFASNSGYKKELALEDVLVPEEGNGNFYAFIDGFVQKTSSSKLTAFSFQDEKMISDVVNLLDWQCRILIMAKSAQDSGDRSFLPNKIAPFVWQKANKAITKYSFVQLKELYEGVADLQLATRLYPQTLPARWVAFITKFYK